MEIFILVVLALAVAALLGVSLTFAQADDLLTLIAAVLVVAALVFGGIGVWQRNWPQAFISFGCIIAFLASFFITNKVRWGTYT